MSVKQRLAKLEAQRKRQPSWPKQSQIGIYTDEADFARQIADPASRHIRVWLPAKQPIPDEHEPMPDLSWLLEHDR